MRKPKTTPFFEFYCNAIVTFFSGFGSGIWDLLEAFYRFIMGQWYCDHCEKWHGRRVEKFDIHYYKSGEPPLTVCSLGLPPKPIDFKDLNDALVRMSNMTMIASTQALSSFNTLCEEMKNTKPDLKGD